MTPCGPPLLDIFHPNLGPFIGISPMNKSLAWGEAADVPLLVCWRREASSHSHTALPAPQPLTRARSRVAALMFLMMFIQILRRLPVVISSLCPTKYSSYNNVTWHNNVKSHDNTTPTHEVRRTCSGYKYVIMKHKETSDFSPFIEEMKR